MTPPPQDDSPTIAPPLGDSPTIGVPAGPDTPPFDPYGGETIGLTAGDSPTIGVTPASSEAGARRAGPLEVSMPFGSRYRILRQLGAGGMGVVYQAWDEELGVAVALKVIRPEVTSDPYVARDVERRFKRELLLAREVTHSNVVRIHDLGEIEGIKYITMSYVDGVDLATLIQQEGRLAVPRALRIIRGVVSGLRAAHEAGVVHRDLKPANIMVDADDCALIMDFGIARSTSRPADTKSGKEDGAAKLFQLRQQAAAMNAQTMQGGVVGTVEYMAPEQARGEEVDQRADIYALGLIMYDMLGGAGRAARSESALVELTGRMQHLPDPLRTINPEVPEPLARVVTRCLEPDRDARHSSTKELEAELDRLDANGNLLPVLRRVSTRQMAGAGVLTLGLLVGTWWLSRSDAPPPEPAPVSVLVADFENKTGDPVFEGSVEQTLTTALEGASFITAYPQLDARRVATQLNRAGALNLETARLVAIREGVKMVLAGSIEPRGSGYQLRVNTIDPTSGTAVDEASARADGKADVLRQVQSLAADVRRSLGDAAPETGIEAGKETFTTGSLEAARLYSQAQDLQSSYRDQEAIDLYKRATALDPNFARAYASWGNSASRLGRKQEADEAWGKALSMIDRMTEREKYRTYGVYYGTVTGNFDEAIKNFKELVTRYPADPAGHNNLALAYFSVLDFPNALEEGRKTLEIYPKILLYRGNYALFAMYASDFQTAEREAQQVIKEDPNYYPAYLPIAVSALASGNRAGALDAYGQMAKAGDAGGSLSVLGYADVALYEGRFGEAVKVLKEGIAADEKNKNTSGVAIKQIALAEAYAGERNTRAALAELTSPMKGSRSPSTLVPAAAVLVALGRIPDAETLAAELENKLQPQTRAYGRILRGQVALKRGRLVEAVEALKGARDLADLWLGRFLLGIAYVEAGYYAEGLRELEACDKRRGEAAAVFLDDFPTYRYAAPLPYWLARAQEGLGVKAAALENYKKYLALRGSVRSDPLASDARRRAAALVAAGR